MAKEVLIPADGSMYSTDLVEGVREGAKELVFMDLPGRGGG